MGDRVGVIGKNGKGKSTLLNLIAGELTARRGSFKRHPALRLAHFGQTNIDRLHRGQTVEEEIMAAVPDHSRGTARGICGLMMFQGDDALKRVDVLSGGERARVLLGKLLVSPANLVLLDEPTNHLDMESIDSLIAALLAFPGGSLIVTHNERVLHALATKLVIFDRGRATAFEGTYQDFLDRVGWGDEDAAKATKKKTTQRKAAQKAKQPQAKAPDQRVRRSRDQDKELRKKRQTIVTARSRALRPLIARFKTLEAEIIALEARLAAANKEMESAAATGDKDGIVRQAKETANLRKQIEVEFAELECVTNEHDETAAEFDQQLARLEG